MPRWGLKKKKKHAKGIRWQERRQQKRDKGKGTRFLIKCECPEPKMIQQYNPSIETPEALRLSIISLVISGWRS